MYNHLNGSTKNQSEVQIIVTPDTKSKIIKAELIDSHLDIATQWFEERHRQARASFNVTIGLWTVTALFGIGVALSVCTNNVPAVVATTSVGLTTGAVSTRFFRLYKEANQSLDRVTKELLDDE
ncbi:TRADD-N-associated membrane domain-containing protein [Nostoc sp. 'Peltigera membranacea cyanobiont' N6]|uniref:TRADD-N-associated membrane domain-containing protein n=1 Tax=Nostoc sp. 'Peltigera membranacea cyanobiont' N6 TaxID=1261031 RepID=UPI000CF35C3F|nr:hypothetical protein [Nostoc sp. 'Peltigera membranacea cyanobiont' N6]AVH65220.1 hypothetical protein NPM_3641 [Nostoc sp. 'Peltigera membranacea cyanobiont' N6]